MTENRLASGWLQGAVHVLPLRVYWEDTDGTGVVYYANYLRFAERARTDLLRLVGIEQGVLLADGRLMFGVRYCEVDYFAPARVDDELQVYTRLTEVRGASLQVEQIVRRGGTNLVRAQVKIACLNPAGGPMRLPTALKDSLAALSRSEHIKTNPENAMN
tara:strand:+ start:71 stop:550 length:480 start_codon:yes stop_codon:yes gene_type:complete